MNKLISRFLISVFFFINLSYTSSLFAQTDEKCDKEKFSEIINDYTSLYQQKKNFLETILSGNYSGNFKPEFFFPADITNKEIRIAYIEELQNESLFDFKEKFPDCTEIALLSQELEELNETYQQYNQLQLQFLSLPEEQQRTLVDSNSTEYQPDSLADQIQLLALNENLELRMLWLKKDRLTSQKWESSDPVEMRILGQLIHLVHLQIKLTQLLHKVSVDYLDHHKNFSLYLQQIKDFENELRLKENSNNTLNNFHNLNLLWRTIVDTGVNKAGSYMSSASNKIPDIPEQSVLIEQPLHKDVVTQYKYEHKRLTFKNKTIYLLIAEGEKNEIKSYDLLIRSISSVRSAYILHLRNKNELKITAFDTDNLQDLRRELMIVPYRLVTLVKSRWIDIRQNAERGIRGLYGLMQTILNILLVFALPFGGVIFLRLISRWIENSRKQIMKEKKPAKHKVRYALFLKFIHPYVPFLLAYMSIIVAETLLTFTYFEELITILPYIKMYIYYRIFLIFFDTNLKRISLKSDILVSGEHETKINQTGKSLGLFFLAVFFILHSLETSVGRAYIYIISETVIYVCSLGMIIAFTIFWKKEILAAVSHTFHNKLFLHLRKAAEGVAGIFLLIPLLLILTISKALGFIIVQLSKMEFTKKSMARIFRKKAEASGAEIQMADIEAMPEEYRKLFTLNVPKEDDIWIYPHTKDLENALAVIKQWISGKSDEGSLAFFGEKGTGKSSLMELVSRKVSDIDSKVIVRKCLMTEKLRSQTDMINFLEKALETNLHTGIDSLTALDEQDKRTLLFIDDAHNAFTGTPGGFEAYKYLVRIVNSRIRNLFICATFNIHSWIYLEGVFYNNRYFRNIVKMSPWKDEDIKKLIMTRNQKAGVRLKFDKIISASLLSSEIESRTNIENRFFSLLWEQSGGNPRAALYTWLSCLTPGKYYYGVGLPVDPRSDIFSDIQSEALFIYAAIIKHENLTSSQIHEVTDIERGMIKYAVKLGTERDFLYRDEDGRYRINPAYHGAAVNFLKQRNMLYEN